MTGAVEDAHARCALQDPSRWVAAHVWLAQPNDVSWWLDYTARRQVFHGLVMDLEFEVVDPESARECLRAAWARPDPERCAE